MAVVSHHPHPHRRRNGLIVLGVMAAVALIAVIIAWPRNETSTPPATEPTTETTTGPSTTASTTAPTTPATAAPTTAAPTTAAPTTAPTAPPRTTTTTTGFDPATAIWPPPSAGANSTSPVGAARSFATLFLGFVDPVVGTFQPATAAATSGAVAVRPTATGPITKVAVNEAADHTWWVTESSTDNIRLDAPVQLANITTPVRVTGTSTAFEATVRVDVRDRFASLLGQGIVMGGANGEMGPFDGTIGFSRDGATSGAVVLATYSMEDGRIWEATVRRVSFPVPLAGCAGAADENVYADHFHMLTKVFYTCSDPDGPLVAVYRVTDRTSAVLRAALQSLLAGPTAAERNAGLTSWFSDKTNGMLQNVVIDSQGTATIDFGDLRWVIPNASSSAGSKLLLSQLDATVFQFPTVKASIYRINGSCTDFTEWLQYGGCTPRTRP